MPNLAPKFNWGYEQRNDSPELVRQLDDLYNNIAIVVNTKSSVNVTNVVPPNNITPASINRNYVIGDSWINTTTNTAWVMTSRTSDLIVNWQQVT